MGNALVKVGGGGAVVEFSADDMIAAVLSGNPLMAAKAAEAKAHYAEKPKAHAATAVPGIKAKVSVAFEVDGLEGYGDDAVKVRPHDHKDGHFVLKCTSKAKLAVFLKKTGMVLEGAPIKGRKHWIATVKAEAVSVLTAGADGALNLLGA